MRDARRHSSAAPLQLLSGERYVWVSSFVSFSGDLPVNGSHFDVATPPTEYIGWFGAPATYGIEGAQLSFATPDQFKGGGSVATHATRGVPVQSGFLSDQDAISKFQLAFEVVEDTLIDLSGVLSIDTTRPDRGSSIVSVTLEDDIGTLYEEQIIQSSDGVAQTGELSFRTTLTPGEYIFEAYAALTDFGGEAAFSFDFVVPEAGTGAMLGLALAALTIRRRS